LHIGNKQYGFAIHSRVNVIPEGKDIAEEPYDARVSSTVLRERRGELKILNSIKIKLHGSKSPLRYSINSWRYFVIQLL
jgi:hypothetical protein